jgi:predicted nucleic acid-binding protein
MAVFADTFYFIALVSSRDARHKKAVEFSVQNRDSIITTEYVLTELADGLAGTPYRPLMRQIRLDLESSPRDTLIPCGTELWRRGCQLYDNRPDKAWSLTDCISFVVMQEQGVARALTGDVHFELAGFVALLR